jgi:hypothetical protein
MAELGLPAGFSEAAGLEVTGGGTGSRRRQFTEAREDQLTLEPDREIYANHGRKSVVTSLLVPACAVTTSMYQNLTLTDIPHHCENLA